MEENFDLLAQSRANYYTKGSSIQFVKVELLKGDQSGDIAVCLSFKNISSQPVTGLLVEFKCKDRTGTVVCQDRFEYQGLNAAGGQVFGSDDAVYISQAPVGSVEVDLIEAYMADGTAQDLTGFVRTRLPAPKKLPEDLAKKLSERTGKEGLQFVPQVLDQGWYCACGAFHPREESGVWCSECGSDRILLQNTLSSMLQAAQTAQQPVADQQPTRMVPPVRPEEPTRAVPPLHPDEEDDADMTLADDRGHARYAASRLGFHEQDAYEDEGGYEEDYEDYDDYDGEMDPRDVIAEKIIRWAPPITAVLCAIVALIGFLLA